MFLESGRGMGKTMFYYNVFENDAEDDNSSQSNLKLENVNPLSNGSTSSIDGKPPAKKDEKEPIKEVLECGAPYPMVVLPVEGDYWMEGTYHILSRDMYDRPIFPTIDRSRCTLDDDQSVYNYRRNFAGKEHTNYVGIDNKYGPILMSVLFNYESASTPIHDNNRQFPTTSSSPKPSRRTREQYKVILRLKNKTIDKCIPATTFESDFPGPREIMKYMLEDEVDVDRFHPVVVPRASEDIMRFDEHSVSNCYKIGVLHQKHGQISEEEYLQNPEETPALREFLDMIGDRVELQDFPHYRGGLDVKHGQTGEHSYYTNFKEKEIMFHVSSMIPFKPNDSQQLSRKRHIGNDVVSIVFQEENTPFCPNSIRSHFLHCFIIVQVENANSEDTHYKVSIAAKEGVPKFAPSLPNPCIFKKGEDFREFLLTKILNAENAAVKSEKFSALAERTRTMLLQGVVSDFIAKNEKMLEDDHLSNGSEQNETHHVKSGSILSTFRSALNRSTRSDHDTTSISSASSSSTTNLSSSKSHSLSLNDLNHQTATSDGEDGSLRKEGSPKFQKKKKDKEKKKEKAKSTILALLPPVSCPISEDNINELSVSPTNAAHYKSSSPEAQTPSRPKSRFYSNQLFDEANSGGDLTNTQSLPRNIRMSGQEQQQTLSTPSDASSQKIQVSTHSDEENNNMHERAESASLDTAKEEIEKLKAEINKLKIDKMDLIRQNVMHQREIKKLHDNKSIPHAHTANDLRTLSLKHSYDPRKMYKATATTFAEFV